MEKNSKAPMIENPVLLDNIIGQIQLGLVNNIGWLDMAFGRAQKLVKMIENKKYFSPNVYNGIANDYISLLPDSQIGNFSFFWLEDPNSVEWVPKQEGVIKSNFSLIFWFDLRRVYNQANNRDTETLKLEIMKVLNGGFWLKNGRVKVNKIYEEAENIYRGFTLDEIDNQFLMHPFAGFRIDGELSIEEPCYN